MSESTRSSSNSDPQLLSQEGGIQLRDFNPKAVLRFTGRKCVTCDGEILDHWIRYDADPDLRAEYWCTRDGNGFSMGIADCTFDVEGVKVPEEHGKAH